MITYHASDSLIRVKNAALARHKEVSLINTKFVFRVMDALSRVGVLREVEISEDKKRIVAKLSYSHKEPTLLDIKIISRPGVRYYASVDELTKRKKSTTLILTTSKGILTHKEALEKGVGGEVICEII